VNQFTQAVFFLPNPAAREARPFGERGEPLPRPPKGRISSVVAELARPQSAPAIKFARPTAMFHNTALKFYRLW
jgi:hypothetical protein